MVNEQLQDTYRPISQDVKTIRSSEIRSLNKISTEKSYTKCGGNYFQTLF